MPKRTHDGIEKRCTCGPRKWAKCKHPWHFSFYHAKREYGLSLDVIAKARGEKPPVGTTEAKAWRDRLRGEIRGGTFVDPRHVPVPVVAADTRLTFGDVVTAYLDNYVNVPTRGARAAAMFKIHLNMLLRAQVPAPRGTLVELRHKPIDAITKADVEAIRAARRAELAAAATARATGVNTLDVRKVRRPGVKAGETGINRLLARLRHVFSWAIVEGHVDDTPFKRHGEKVITLASDAESNRDRRLHDGEEAALLEHAPEDLRTLIIAALATGCRLGELLSLRWAQVTVDADGSPQTVKIIRTKTRTNKVSVIPVSRRLRAVLTMRRNAPDGQPHLSTACVFGNAVGEPVTSIRAAWEATCAAAKITGLHFHDLRREFACRLLESSSALHDVQEFLGHGNITTTSTYLKSTSTRLVGSLDRMEAALDLAEGANDGPDSDDEKTPDSHTIRTNGPETTNDRSEGPAVTH